MTSLAFMFDDVPDPVWYTSIGNSSSQRPSATSSAAAAMAAAMRLSTLGTSFRPALTAAASDLISASARISRGSMVSPEIGKFSTARWVWAAYLAVSGHPHVAHRVVLDAKGGQGLAGFGRRARRRRRSWGRN